MENLDSIEDLSINIESSKDFLSVEDDGKKVTHRKKIYGKNSNPNISRNGLNNTNYSETQRSKLAGPGSALPPPINYNIYKEYSRNYLIDDFPTASMHSENKSPFGVLPHSPQDKPSLHEEITREYLSSVTHKNSSTVNAILKDLITSSNFPSPSDNLLMEDFSLETNYNEPERDNMCKPCCGKEEKSLESRSTRDTCSPQNCDKLNLSGVKKWKTCCNEEHCPVNDPTSSTYNFLLKVRMCCRTKGCQLASKICDIYEPLVEIDANLDDVGERQYHYLAADESTDMHVEEDEKPASPVLEESQEQVDATSLLADESEYEITLPDEDIRESVYVDPGDIGSGSKRASTVSWSMPRDYEMQGSTSQEQVVSQATAEADKFRQTPTIPRHGSVFGDIVQKGLQEPVDLDTYRPSAVLFKSRIDSIGQNDSQHKQKCCPSLKRKFKKKKKKSVKLEDSEITAWGVSSDHERRKSTRTTIPVEEKTEQINTMLNKV